MPSLLAVAGKGTFVLRIHPAYVLRTLEHLLSLISPSGIFRIVVAGLESSTHLLRNNLAMNAIYLPAASKPQSTRTCPILMDERHEMYASTTRDSTIMPGTGTGVPFTSKQQMVELCAGLPSTFHPMQRSKKHLTWTCLPVSWRSPSLQ